MTVVLAGSVLDSGPSTRYAEKLRFAELALTAPLPRPATLSRWRERLPENFVIALRAPTDAARPAQRSTPGESATEQALTWTREAADALRACAVIFATPLEVTPGQRSRDWLRDFFEALPAAQDRLWVWEPSGLWERRDAYALAGRLGVTCTFDPTLDDGPDHERRYARLLGVGARPRFSSVILEKVYERVAAPGCRTAYVAIQSQRSPSEAQQLQQIADAARLDGPDDAGVPDPTDDDTP